MDQFGDRKQSSDGKHYACRDCINKAAAAARENRRERNAADAREYRKRPEVKAAAAARRARPEQREAARQRTQRWRDNEQNRQSALKKKRESYADDPEPMRKYQEGYRADPENRKKMREYQARRYRKQRVTKLAYSADYRANNEELLREKRRLRRQSDPMVRERDRLNKALRRARRLEAPTGEITVRQLAKKVRYWGSRCWVCGDNWTAIDHVKPLTKGGAHMLCNLRPICTSCNSSKGSKWPLPSREEILGLRGLLRANRQVRPGS